MTHPRSDRRTFARTYADWGRFSQIVIQRLPDVKSSHPAECEVRASVQATHRIDFEPAPADEHLGWIEPRVEKRVRLSPSKNSEIIGHAAAGAPARVTAIHGVWFQSTFLTRDGQLQGWITRTDVEHRPVT